LSESRRDRGLLELRIIARFGFCRRNVSDWLQQSAIVEPVDPLERGELDRLEASPRPLSPDQLGLVESVDRLGERIVVTVADAADRGLDAGLGEALGVFNRDVLNAAVAMMDEAAAVNRPTTMQRLLERVEHEARMRRAIA
jgi:hypothetical protein